MEHLEFLLKVGGTARRKFSSCKGYTWSRSRSFFLRVVPLPPHRAVVLRLWRSRRCFLNSSPDLPASLWNGAVQQWALLGKMPQLHLAMGSGWGFICCWQDLNWESGDFSMGLAITSCEFVQPFAIQVCTGTCDQSLEARKWDGAESASKPSAALWLGMRMMSRQGGSLAAPVPPSLFSEHLVFPFLLSLRSAVIQKYPSRLDNLIGKES